MPVRLQVEKLVYGGDGLARHDGAIVFVPFVLPGEEIEVDLRKISAGVKWGTTVAWSSRSEHRTQPPCPLFSECGGCHYQHIAYEQEVTYKAEILRETLRRIGGIEWGNPIEASTAAPFGYRNRAQLHLSRSHGQTEVGFLAGRSHRLVAARECAINSPALNRAHGMARRMAADRRFPSDLATVEFFTNEDRVQLNFPRRSRPLPQRFWNLSAEMLGIERPGVPLDYACGRDVFRVSGRSFFQVNRHLAGPLQELATRRAAGDLAIDLYAGVGLFSVPLARAFRHVVAVDSAASAMRDLRANARRAAVSLRAVHMDVDRFLRDLSERPDLIVADPPRTGLGRVVVREILRVAAPELRLVSCNPATLGRDLRLLLQGGYELAGLHMVDLFPQTFHIEAVAHLCRR